MNKPISIVLCKKDYRFYYDNNQGSARIAMDEEKPTIEMFNAGEYYKDFQLETINYEPLHPIVGLYKYIYIWNKDKNGGIRFHLSKDRSINIYLPWFYDYFYDEQEIRKIKLKNLKK